MSILSPIAPVAGPGAQLGLLDLEEIRADFPILSETVHRKPLVYLDNAATTQKPRSVLDAVDRFYVTECANVHRGVHLLSQRATNSYEGARQAVQRFINSRETREIIFVRGTTEAVNLVAQTYGRQHVGAGDEILVTAMEHHSNIVPWQMLCAEKNATLKVAPIDDSGALILEEYEKLLTPHTRLVSCIYVSNALGTINPVREMIRLAHSRGIPVMVDGAQAVPHLAVDVQDLDSDFFAFSSHKMFGPTGIGVLHGKADLLEAMPPYQGGGEMIASVSWDKTVYNRIPHKFEAGTPDIAGPIGLRAAMDYMQGIGIERIGAHEADLLDYATAAVDDVPGLRIIGTAGRKASVLSFVLEDIHPHDIGTILDQEGIAIRTGHHCAQPVMERFGLAATARASFAFYNTRAEVDALVSALRRVREVFA